MKDFVADVIRALNATRASKIGVIRFSSSPRIVIPLASTHNLSAQVQAIGYTSGGTATHTALDLMVTQLATASAEGAAPIGILLTDGQSNSPARTLEAAARVHAAGISMYTFGIGDTDQDELQAIASSPFYDYSFYISSFNTAEFEERVLLLTRQTCSSELCGYNDVTVHSPFKLSSYSSPPFKGPHLGTSLRWSFKGVVSQRRCLVHVYCMHL